MCKFGICIKFTCCKFDANPIFRPVEVTPKVRFPSCTAMVCYVASSDVINLLIRYGRKSS